MEDHPRFRAMCSHRPVHKASIFMGSFSAATPKPSWLYSNRKWISDISRFEPGVRRASTDSCCNKLVQVREGRDGRLRVSGGPKLKQSQHYTREFGNALVQLHLSHLDELLADAAS
eukprot:1858457-Alexandrium_andersonii.AAC.1